MFVAIYNWKESKRKFKMILETVLVTSNAILTGALADYYLYKTTGNIF